MPNRILKESICISDSIDSLSWFEEVLFYRLIVNCDDFGRFYGKAAIIKNRLFPLKDKLTTNTVEAAIERLASIGIVTMYEYDGKPYLYLPSWDSHQTRRATKSKFPDPPENQPNNQLHESEINCMQMQANVSDIRNSEFDIRNSEFDIRDGVPKHHTPYPYSEIIEYLNERCNTAFKANSKSTQSHINARFSEGYTLDDFKTVIDKKSAEWLSDPKMSKFLRPETLFGNKFESYLNQPKTGIKVKKSYDDGLDGIL